MKTYFGHVSEGGIGGQPVSVDDGTGKKPLRHIERHSPDGFNWGYGGSGPADLALAILSDYFGEFSAQVQAYQSFKFDVIAKLKKDRVWMLTGILIDEWWKDKKTEIEGRPTS